MWYRDRCCHGGQCWVLSGHLRMHDSMCCLISANFSMPTSSKREPSFKKITWGTV